MTSIDNVWALLLHLEKVIWESSLLALCPFSQIWPCKSRTRGPAAIHDSFTTSGPPEALEAHALLIKCFVGEFIFKAYATWKLMITSQAAEHCTEKPWWAIYERFTLIYNLFCNHHNVSSIYSIM